MANEGKRSTKLDAPIGTKLSEYAETGPYRCGDCIHFGTAKSSCDHPEVVADPEVPKLANGLGHVNARRGCCRYVSPPRAKSAAERSGMRG